MGKVLPKKLGNVYDSFEFSRDDNFVGTEFKQNFVASLSSTVRDIRVVFNDDSLSNVLVRGVIRNFADDNKQIIFESYGNGFFNRNDDKINLGAGQYFGIETIALDTGTPPGGKVVLVMKSNNWRD